MENIVCGSDGRGHNESIKQLFTGNSQMAPFGQKVISMVKRSSSAEGYYLLCRRVGGLMSEKSKEMGNVSPTEKIRQAVRMPQVCIEQKCFPCCLIGQLTKANAVKCVQKEAEGAH